MRLTQGIVRAAMVRGRGTAIIDGAQSFTWNEIASSNLNCGPPLMATNGTPSSSNSTVITSPAGWMCIASGE